MDEPAAPFEPLHICGASITIPVNWSDVILPTDHPYILPTCNEYTLTEGRAFTEGIYIFTNDYDSETGLRNLYYPWIAGYDDSGTIADFYYFTERPKNFSYVASASGVITQITVYPGNGLVYWGRIDRPDLIRDSNSDLIPDILDINVVGSIPHFLRPYGCVEGKIGVKQFLTADNKEFLTADGKYLFVRA
jgi:hypothetical protein